MSTDEAIYAIAGTGDQGPVLAVERFDGDVWSDTTNLPGRGLNAPAAVAINGKLLVIGGFGTDTNVPVSTVWEYDPATSQWSAGADLPAASGGHAAVVLGGLVHVLGGGNSRSTIADHSVYDPVSRQWRERAPLPRAEGSPAAAVMNGILYAIGGRSGAQDFGDVYLYDPASDSWKVGPSIGPRATCGALCAGGAIRLIGGESQATNRVLAETVCLEPGGSSWVPGPALPTARSFARAVLFRRAIYVVGGARCHNQTTRPGDWRSLSGWRLKVRRTLLDCHPASARLLTYASRSPWVRCKSSDLLPAPPRLGIENLRSVLRP